MTSMMESGLGKRLGSPLREVGIVKTTISAVMKFLNLTHHSLRQERERTKNRKKKVASREPWLPPFLCHGPHLFEEPSLKIFHQPF